MIKASVGVMAYNEEQNISKLLEALTTQRLDNVEIGEIFVVSSGSTDRTDDIVRDWADRDARVTLIRQESRRGKASAINLFLEAAAFLEEPIENLQTLESKGARGVGGGRDGISRLASSEGKQADRKPSHRPAVLGAINDLPPNGARTGSDSSGQRWSGRHGHEQDDRQERDKRPLAHWTFCV